MRIEVEEFPRLSIEEFADLHDLVMQVKERCNPPNHSSRFYANFRSTDVKEGSFLVGEFGNGSTQEEAIQNYAKQIQLKTLVFDAYGSQRKEIQAPIFI